VEAKQSRGGISPVKQELITGDENSERELLHSAPGSYPNSLKKRKITPVRRSVSYKVTDFGTNGKLIYDRRTGDSI